MSGFFNSGYNNNSRSFEQQQFPPNNEQNWRVQNQTDVSAGFVQQPQGSWRAYGEGGDNSRQNNDFNNGREWRSYESNPAPVRPTQRVEEKDQDWRSYERSTSSRNSQEDDRDWRRNDYNDRRGNRDERERETRDRSPSSREDRDSWRRRDNRDRNYRRTPPRRSRSPPRRDGRDANATNKVMLTAVPENIDRDEMNIIISQQGFCPIDVRIIHKPSDTGLRSFGFIEFNTIDAAKDYMKYNNGFLKFPNNYNCRLEYAREPHAPDNSRLGNTAGGPADWNCAKCGINNFNRRENCFKCGINKRDSDELQAKGYNMVGSEPCDTLLVRELPNTATELSVMQAFSLYSPIPIQRVHLGNSKRYCLMQMRSLEEANYFLQSFNRVVPQINNCVVILSYSRISLNKVLMADSVEAIKSQTGVSTSQVQKDPTNSAAMLAYNAIQMSKMGRAPNPNDRQTISTPLGVFPIYPKPDTRVLQLEPTTGYFYDPNTGFYYDPKTDYYYDPLSCQWCFWTTEFSTFIPCSGDNVEIRTRLQQNEKNLKEREAQGENPEVAAENEKKKKKKEKKAKEEEDPNKPKTAKDIQREMNQWAKRQEKIKLSFNTDKETEEKPALSSTANAWEADEDLDDPTEEVSTSTYERNDPEPKEPPPRFDLNEFLDKSLIACLLCQRQFKSLEVLDKHCQKSDLHKTNVANKMAEMGIQLGNPTNEEAKPSLPYRDRAKERRQLYGIDPGLDEVAGGQSEINITEEAAKKAVRPIDDTNIGNKLLKSMGWQEGTGLGKKQQGIVNPIAAEQRVQGVGLGAAGSKVTNMSWKDRVKQSTLARYQDLQDREQH